MWASWEQSKRHLFKDFYSLSGFRSDVHDIKTYRSDQPSSIVTKIGVLLAVGLALREVEGIIDRDPNLPDWIRDSPLGDAEMEILLDLLRGRCLWHYAIK